MKRFVSVCITGVDGTGKSTAVKRLSDYFGNEKSEIQYMGSNQDGRKISVKAGKDVFPDRKNLWEMDIDIRDV